MISRLSQEQFKNQEKDSREVSSFQESRIKNNQDQDSRIKKRLNQDKY